MRLFFPSCITGKLRSSLAVNNSPPLNALPDKPITLLTASCAKVNKKSFKVVDFNSSLLNSTSCGVPGGKRGAWRAPARRLGACFGPSSPAHTPSPPGGVDFFGGGEITSCPWYCFVYQWHTVPLTHVPHQRTAQVKTSAGFMTLRMHKVLKYCKPSELTPKTESRHYVSAE